MRRGRYRVHVGGCLVKCANRTGCALGRLMRIPEQRMRGIAHCVDAFLDAADKTGGLWAKFSDRGVDQRAAALLALERGPLLRDLFAFGDVLVGRNPSAARSGDVRSGDLAPVRQNKDVLKASARQRRGLGTAS